MPHMPDRPETWAMVLAWLEHHHPLVYAAVLSATLAAARLVYSGGSIRRALGEGFICGLITLALSNGLPLFGMPPEVAPSLAAWSASSAPTACAPASTNSQPAR